MVLYHVEQCCTSEQALQLKSLGVPQHGVNLWVEEGSSGAYTRSSFNAPVDAHGNDCVGFTAAELGEMLPPYWVSGKSVGHLGPMAWYCEFPGQLKEYGASEAQARAGMLIFLLQAGIIQVEELPAKAYAITRDEPFSRLTPGDWLIRFTDAVLRHTPADASPY
jgi:hypothetical protein